MVDYERKYSISLKEWQHLRIRDNKANDRCLQKGCVPLNNEDLATK